MPLEDLYETAHEIGELFVFRMEGEDRKVVVQVTVEAVQDVDPKGHASLEKFDANRGLYGALASDKYDAGDYQTEPPVVRVTTSDLPGCL